MQGSASRFSDFQSFSHYIELYVRVAQIWMFNLFLYSEILISILDRFQSLLNNLLFLNILIKLRITIFLAILGG